MEVALPVDSYIVDFTGMSLYDCQMFWQNFINSFEMDGNESNMKIRQHIWENFKSCGGFYIVRHYDGISYIANKDDLKDDNCISGIGFYKHEDASAFILKWS